MSSDRLFQKVTVSYNMYDPGNERFIMPRSIEDVTDISACIHRSAKSARELGLLISTFTVEVQYE